eukprot:351494-Chlamydomonas_euryale.AAC.3
MLPLSTPTRKHGNTRNRPLYPQQYSSVGGPSPPPPPPRRSTTEVTDPPAGVTRSRRNAPGSVPSRDSGRPKPHTGAAAAAAAADDSAPAGGPAAGAVPAAAGDAAPAAERTCTWPAVAALFASVWADATAAAAVAAVTSSGPDAGEWLGGMPLLAQFSMLCEV